MELTSTKAYITFEKNTGSCPLKATQMTCHLIIRAGRTFGTKVSVQVPLLDRHQYTTNELHKQKLVHILKNKVPQIPLTPQEQIVLL